MPGAGPVVFSHQQQEAQEGWFQVSVMIEFILYISLMAGAKYDKIKYVDGC